MFTFRTRQHATALAFAALFTFGMLGAVDALATHPAHDAVPMAKGSALQDAAQA
jgi:hypothetical protein